MALGGPMLAAERVTINLVTAGDQNMVDLFQNELGPEFSKANPGITVRVVGTGPGDAGSQKIIEKLRAQKNAGKESWDIDVAIIHEIGASWAVQDGLLLKYAPSASTYKYVTSASAKRALGTDVEGYVIPMFHSQTVLAYNPKYIPNPPRTFEELVEWVKKNPRRFGYNGLKNGMSGVSFVASWLYWKTGKYHIYALAGPYDKKYEEDWDAAFSDLKEFNKYVVITAGNAGTLDMLNRGEIWIGPVWVDMFYSWMADGRMDPNMRLVLPAPGMAGQPMYYVIPAKAAHADAALKFIEFATSPKIQAKYIVEKFNWYPGIDGSHVREYLSEDAWNRLFRDVSPSDLVKYGKAFPIKPYYNDMMEAYEKAMR
ncbi:MAG TPA: extracellular solute-binding protein [Firmicutes bacterium]|nr:extracellular solute-binding protein [Bacillota bacterium]